MEENKDIFDIRLLDYYLGSLGFVCPSTEEQYDVLNLLNSDHKFKLDGTQINIDKIIKGKGSISKLVEDTNVDLNVDYNELKMAARKGSNVISQNIIDKMYGKHRKDKE